MKRYEKIDKILDVVARISTIIGIIIGILFTIVNTILNQMGWLILTPVAIWAITSLIDHIMTVSVCGDYCEEEA